MIRKRQITIETHSITIIRASGSSAVVTCETCREPVTAFPPAQIATALRLSATEIEALRQSGEIHSDSRNSVLVCGNSLAEILRRINQ